MKRALMVSIPVLLFLGLFASSVLAQNTLVRFEGGIGVIPVSSGVGQDPTAEVVNRNIVRGVQPPGQIWVIDDLRAEVKTNGEIKVDGRGLLLGGGNNIGTNANQSVRARLFCDNVAHNSDLVPLEANGDFRINDVLDPIPPAVCGSPVLLIRNADNEAWFAAGIPKLD